MRPLGSKSSQYKKKNNLNYSSLRSLIKDYSNMSNSDLCKKYNISKGQFRNIRIQYKLKSKNLSEIARARKKLVELNGVCGVYLMLRSDGLKGYIGSSYNIGDRVKNHLNSLACNTHYNKTLQNDWSKYTFSFYLVKECGEENLLDEENVLISKYDDFVLYNKNVTYKHDIDYEKLYNKIISKIEIKNDCWEWTGKLNKGGYGVVSYHEKRFYAHRISYIYNNETYPMVVHHTCKNRKCCNPKHLESVSSKKNAEQNILANLKRSKLFPHLEEVREMLKNNIPYKTIWTSLNLNISYESTFRFCKKVETLLQN